MKEEEYKFQNIDGRPAGRRSTPVPAICMQQFAQINKKQIYHILCQL